MGAEYPLTRYRGAVLMKATTRKPTQCSLCHYPIPVGTQVWRPLVENIRGGITRTKRYHLRHFKPGQVYS